MDYQIRGTREVTIIQEGTAWVSADSPEEARELADDPDALEWDWDDLDAEDGQIDSIEIVSIKSEDDLEAAEAEAEEGEE